MTLDSKKRKDDERCNEKEDSNQPTCSKRAKRRNRVGKLKSYLTKIPQRIIYLSKVTHSEMVQHLVNCN